MFARGFHGSCQRATGIAFGTHADGWVHDSLGIIVRVSNAVLDRSDDHPMHLGAGTLDRTQTLTGLGGKSLSKSQQYHQHGVLGCCDRRGWVS